MANDLNVVAVVGRVTKDVTLEYTNSGTSYCQFSIACAEWIPGQNGQDGKEETSFFDVKLWGKTAENFVAKAQKGTVVSISGRLRQERWEKDGSNFSKLAIKALSVNCLSGYKTQNAPQQAQQTQYGQGHQQGYQNPPQAPQTPYGQPQPQYSQQGFQGGGFNQPPQAPRPAGPDVGFSGNAGYGYGPESFNSDGIGF